MTQKGGDLGQAEQQQLAVVHKMLDRDILVKVPMTLPSESLIVSNPGGRRSFHAPIEVFAKSEQLNASRCCPQLRTINRKESLASFLHTLTLGGQLFVFFNFFSARRSPLISIHDALRRR